MFAASAAGISALLLNVLLGRQLLELTLGDLLGGEQTTLRHAPFRGSVGRGQRSTLPAEDQPRGER